MLWRGRYNHVFHCKDIIIIHNSDAIERNIDMKYVDLLNVSCSGMKESVDRKIPLPGVSLDTAEAFVFVLYTGSLPEDIHCQPLDCIEVLAELMSLSHRLRLYGNN